MIKKRKEFMIFVAVILLVFILDFMRPIDSTDKSRWKRSGLHLYIDQKTGVQYIKGGYFGQMIPRLDQNGNPVTERNKDE